MMVGLGFVGFVDDFMKTHKQRSLGLSGWAKIAGQGVVAIAFAIMALQLKDAQGWSPASASISIVRDNTIDLMAWGPILGLILFVIWIYFLVASTSNGVNIADGLDGLATGSSAMSIGAYAVIGFWQFNQSCFAEVAARNCYEVKDSLDLAVVASAIVGALIGFLWWNTSPAQIFLGDTGSMAIGGALAALAVLSHTELLLPIIAGLFVMDTGSVILQLSYFKLTRGKRIFLMSPIHHHFEGKGWAEWTVVVRFWIIEGLCVAAGVGFFYLEWLNR
jgi:phospho-N-acetylmuramoyl-pentapeptide-transferase